MQNSFFFPLFLMFFQFYIEKEQAAWFSHPKCSKNDWYAWTANLRSLQRNLIWKLGCSVLSEKKKQNQNPESQKTKDVPLSRYFRQGIYCHWCFWKLLSPFLMSSPDTKKTKKKIIGLLLLNTHQFPGYPQQWCQDCGNQWWDDRYLGPAKRCGAVHPGSQRRVHSLGKEVAAKEGCEALLRGALHGEADLLPDKNTFIFKERIWTVYWVCVGERDSTDCRCWEEPRGKPFLMSH